MYIWSSIMVNLQKIGKSLMLPIASLPVAAIFMGLGNENIFNSPVMTAAGGAVLSSLPLIFCVGVSIGFSDRNKLAAAFAGVISYLIFKNCLETFTIPTEIIREGKAVIENKPVDMAVLGGIFVGLLTGFVSDRVVNWKIPEFLGFFAGARLVPIISGLLAFFLAVICGYIWPPVQLAIDQVGVWITGAGYLGLFIYGFLNRMLIITGLHHVINSLVWFIFGTYKDATGQLFYGDIHRFSAGDPSAGVFTAGMYPIMLFGLPAAAIAIILMAKPSQRKVVSSIMLSAALASFLTGITEPIEFSFMLVAPFLYFVHAILTGVVLAVTSYFDIHLGFTFSAGLIDYCLMYTYPAQRNAFLIIPIGLVVGLVYFFLFVGVIKLFNIKTPGREDKEELEGRMLFLEGEDCYEAILQALGGVDNIIATGYCITRLRLELNDFNLVDKEALKAQGSKGTVQPGGKAYQVIFGSKAEKISEYIQSRLDR